MSTLVVAEKACTKCGGTKPLTDFWRNRRARDGHQTRCKSCQLDAVRRYQERKRSEDPEGFKARNRASTARTRNSDRNRLVGAAREAARTALVERHQAEYEHLLRLEKYERGLL